MRPTVGIEHGPIQLLVRDIQPGRALVVEVGQRALFQIGFAGALGIQPAVALLNKLAGGCGDRRSARIALGLAAGRPGEREGLEGGGGGVAKATLNLTKLCAHTACPQLMYLRVQNTKEIVVVTSKDNQLMVR